MKTAAIITARGGSKGLPGKNIAPLRGKPLIVYSIEAALQSGVCESCIVTTEDVRIKNISLAAGAVVIDRPPELATDNASTESAVEHALRELEACGHLPEFFILLQPTSPLRTAAHIAEAYSKFTASDVRSMISVTAVEHHPYKCLKLSGNHLEPLFSAANLSTPRQELPQIYRQNGAIYIIRSRDFLKEQTLFVPPVLPYIMDHRASVDVDSMLDLKLCEEVLNG